MSKHTKGPWQHLGDPEDDECRVRQTASVRRGEGFYSEITICENIRTKANADLIAAAPDLLEALEGMMQVYGGGTQWNPPTSTELELHDLARAAITRARGEA